MRTIRFCCPAKHERRVSAEPESHNLAKIFRAIPRASAAAIHGRDSSGPIAAADAIAGATIVAVAAGRSAAAPAEDAPARVSNAEVLEVRTVIRAATRAPRAVRNSFPKC